nr:hypothetical protein [Tanacetum cinerariifolium]
DYFAATPESTSADSSNDLTKYLLATLVFSPLHDDPYKEVMQAYNDTNELNIPPLQAPIASPTVMPPVLSLYDSQDFLPPEEISPPKDAKTPVESSISASLSSLVGSSSSLVLPKQQQYHQQLVIGWQPESWLSGGGVIDLTDDEDPTKEDRDAEMDDSTGVLASLGGEISSGGRKSWESYSDNTGGITVGEAIGACSGGIFNSLVALYACITSLYSSSCKGEKTNVAKRYLVKSFEESAEVLSGVATK